MVDELIARLLPAFLFGAITGGVLWLLGLIRKRAALGAAVLLALCFLAGRWATTLPAAAQLAGVAIAGWLLAFRTRLRLRDVVSLLAPATLCAAAAWAVPTTPAYWDAAFAGALVAGAAAWIGRAASDRFAGPAVRLLTLRPTDAAGLNGPGAVCAVIAAVAALVPAIGMGFLGPGEPGLALAGAAVGLAVADFLRRDRAGAILAASALGALATTGLVASLP